MADDKSPAAVEQETTAQQKTRAVGAGFTLAAALCLAAYAYSAGYLLQIEPQFISALSPTDLILWAASSLLIKAAALFGLVFGPVLGVGMIKEVRPESKGPGVFFSWKWRIILALVAALITFALGNWQGLEVRNDQASLRASVCGTEPDNRKCYPVVFLGSEKIIVFQDGEYVLRKVEEHERIVSHSPPPYLPQKALLPS